EFEEDYDQKAYEVLVEYLKQNQQKIIVFHDDFGQFLDKIGKTSTHRLRNILMNSSEIRLVGASATLLEHTADYSKPFFDFFYQIRLKGMTSEETIMLFEKLAENEGETERFAEILKTERPRIEVMRKLSGGVIRTMVMLFDVFMDNEKQDSFKDLEIILDRVTPLYKHRMDDLKPQQQLIVDAVARAWDAVTVSEIAELARSERQGLKTNQISAQLKQLVDNQIIEIEPRTTGRTHLYRLQERFFNIWYLMRYSTRQDKQRVIWFVKFLEGWCNTNDLKLLFERFDNNLEKGTYELNTVFDRALAYSMVDDDEVLFEKYSILDKAINYLLRNNFDSISIQLLENEKNNLVNGLSTEFSQALTLTIDELSTLKDVFSEYLNNRLLIILISNQGDSIFFELVFLMYLHRFRKENNLENFKILETCLYFIIEFGDNTKIDLSDYFIVLLAKKSYFSSYKLFHKYPKLKDRLKPIYFLTMEYLKDEYPNEYLKAGEEMRETIEELKERVKWFEENLN
ncbi:MAG: hypothetical protein MUF45_11500, partial [Spirosomaceae bacterium]|nr:hypothetical protein [Spirosomataceae bacterium]